VAKAINNGARPANDNPLTEITPGADTGCDAKEFINALLKINAIPHARRTPRDAARRWPTNRRRRGLRQRDAENEMHRARLWLCQDSRADSPGDGAQTEKVDRIFVQIMAARSLKRMRYLGEIRLLAV